MFLFVSIVSGHADESVASPTSARSALPPSLRARCGEHAGGAVFCILKYPLQVSSSLWGGAWALRGVWLQILPQCFSSVPWM